MRMEMEFIWYTSVTQGHWLISSILPLQCSIITKWQFVLNTCSSVPNNCRLYSVVMSLTTYKVQNCPFLCAALYFYFFIKLSEREGLHLYFPFQATKCELGKIFGSSVLPSFSFSHRWEALSLSTEHEGRSFNSCHVLHSFHRKEWDLPQRSARKLQEASNWTSLGKVSPKFSSMKPTPSNYCIVESTHTLGK